MGKAVIYATGLTKSIKPMAVYIAKQLGADIFNLKDLMRLNLTEYDEIIFGTTVHGASADKLVMEFMEQNKDVLASKKLHLFVYTKSVAEKAEQECNAMAELLKIPDAVCFSKKAEEMNEAGLPAAVDDYIAKL